MSDVRERHQRVTVCREVLRQHEEATDAAEIERSRQFYRSTPSTAFVKLEDVE